MITEDVLFILDNASARVRKCAKRAATRRAPETARAFNKMNHLSRRMDRERMLREGRPRTDIGCHVANKVELPVGCL